MCRTTSSTAYSSRRLVAVVASGPDTPGTAGGPGNGHVTPPDVTPDPPRMPSPAASWRNLTQPMPLRPKIRLIVRNNAIKIRNASTCCGHPGEPGC